MQLEILGIGSALVDITVLVDDTFLSDHQLPKGGMTLVEHPVSESMLSKLKAENPAYSAGGAAANVISTFAALGGQGGFIGKINQDHLGELFKNHTQNAGVHFFPVFSEQLATGRVLSLISEDSERTFATYLGAASEMTPDDFNTEIFGQTSILLIEAYLIFNEALFIYILEQAKAKQCRIALDLSSFTVVNAKKELLQQIVREYVDILFANEEECLAFTGKNPENSLHELTQLCDLVVLKEGGKGSWVGKGEQIFNIKTAQVDVKDTNGAGDAYAGGFLYGLSRNCTPDVCGQIGSLAGSLMVSQSSARFTEDNIQLLASEVKKILGENS